MFFFQSSSDGMQLYLELLDGDFFDSEDDLIDRFVINITAQVDAPTPFESYSGIFGYANITLSFVVACTEGFTGPDCIVNTTDSPPPTSDAMTTGRDDTTMPTESTTNNIVAFSIFLLLIALMLVMAVVVTSCVCLCWKRRSEAAKTVKHSHHTQEVSSGNQMELVEVDTNRVS